MAVRIRLKRMGRRHRPFFRICAMDARTPRDGRVIEELGYYDPMVPEVDARAIIKGERVDYWLGVGAQATPKVGVLIKKYGSNGTHLEQQKTALEKLKIKPQAPPPVAIKAKEEPKPEEATQAEAAEGAPEATAETAAVETSGDDGAKETAAVGATAEPAQAEGPKPDTEPTES